MTNLVRIERDPGFWAAVASHPEVAAHLGASVTDFAAFIQRPGVTPLAAEHGGYIFSRLDHIGFIYELHTLFTPEAWGRIVAASSHDAFRYIFGNGAQVILTYEQEGWWRSRPPRSHGWKRGGDYAQTDFGSLALWVLTLDAWREAPAVRRNTACLH